MYFDNAATTLIKPDGVARAVAYAINSFGNPERGVHSSSLNASRVVFDARSKLAKLLNAENASCIAFTANATTALNIAINGIVSPGDEVVTTAMEHNSILRPLYRLAGVSNRDDNQFIDGVCQYSNKCSDSINLKIVATDKLGRLDMGALEKAITSHTKAVFVTHASNVTGNINDIKKISKIASKNHALLIVDAAQTAGAVDIDVQKMGIDILCFTGHKSLFGPQGTGGLYVRPGIKLSPLLVGGSGIQSYNKIHPTCMPTALEAGTLNAHGVAGLNAALDWIEDNGVSNIAKRESKILFRFYNAIKDMPHIKIYGDFSTKYRCPICSISIDGMDCAAVSDMLGNEYNIATRAGAHCAPLMHTMLGTEQTGVVRFSFSYFNTFKEVNKAVKIISNLNK